MSFLHLENCPSFAMTASFRKRSSNFTALLFLLRARTFVSKLISSNYVCVVHGGVWCVRACVCVYGVWCVRACGVYVCVVCMVCVYVSCAACVISLSLLHTEAVTVLEPAGCLVQNPVVWALAQACSLIRVSEPHCPRPGQSHPCCPKETVSHLILRPTLGLCSHHRSSSTSVSPGCSPRSEWGQVLSLYVVSGPGESGLGESPECLKCLLTQMPPFLGAGCA